MFLPTPLSLSFLQPVFGAWLIHLYDATLPCALATPSFLAETDYRDPVDASNGIFQYAKGGYKGDLFAYYAENPREGETFNQVMGAVMADQAGWVDIWPYEQILRNDTKASDQKANGVKDTDVSHALVVDVGGNIGHDIERFRVLHPETAGRLYLEDRPEVVERSKCPAEVNKIGYDFFTPQPIKGTCL